MASVPAAKKLAQKSRDIAWWACERGRVAAEIELHRQRRDLIALSPIPQRVLCKGFAGTGVGLDVRELGVWWRDSARHLRDENDGTWVGPR